MEDLRNVMKIVDENVHKISEGDYLKLCNLMHKIYKDKSKEGMKTMLTTRTLMYLLMIKQMKFLIISMITFITSL